jgi:hypothetical protein
MTNIKEQVRDIVLTDEEKKLLNQNQKNWYSWQEDVLKSDSDKIALVGARQTGKTELIINWAEQNNALILVHNQRRKREVQHELDKRNIKRTSVEAYVPSKTDLRGINVAIDEVQDVGIKTTNRVLWCATDISPKKTGFNDFCFHRETDVYTSYVASCPGISKEREEDLRESLSPESIVREMEGKIVIDPNEL